MKKMTETQILRMLKDAAARRYGRDYAKALSPALRETAKAIAGEKNQDLAPEREPSFFSR